MKSLFFDVNLPRIALTKALAPLYPGVFYSRLSALCFRDIEEPKLPGEDWVKVKTRMCGICGSDVHLVSLRVDPRVSLAALPKHLPKGAPKFLGHEVAGEVAETGSRVEGFQPGDAVTLRTGPCCATLDISPPCPSCEMGNYSICRNRSEAELPANTGGGWSEYFVVHEAQLFKIPEGLSDEHAALLEPTACSLHTVLRRKPEEEDKVLVIGGGFIGLNAVQIARIVTPGCFIAALVKYPFQAEAARRMGADEVLYAGDGELYEKVGRIAGGKVYRGRFGNQVVMGGFDVIYDCVGTARTLHDGLRWARSRGTIVLVGSDLNIKRFDYTPLWHQEISLIGSEAHGMEQWNGESISTFDLVSRLILEKKLDLSGMITHRFALSEYREAMKVLLNRRGSGVIKGAFVFA